MSANGGLDPAAIERALQDMWRAAGAESPERPVVRAALVNFIVLGSDRAALADTVTRVSEVVPCRALVVESGDAQGPMFDAWTSMHCRAVSRGPQVCCEQVTIRVRPDALDGLPSALLGLLLPDLPTVLAVLDDADLEGPVPGRLARHVARLIVDSAAFSRPEAQLTQLDTWRRRDVEVADLNWSRLDAWRELFAALFDAPPFDQRLRELTRVEIEYAVGARAAALLFAGWLESCLGWRRTGGSTDRPVFAAAGRRVEVLLASRADGEPPALLRVEALAADGTRFSVETDPLHPTVLVGCTRAAGPCPRPRRVESRIAPPEAALVEVLQRVPRNPAHAAALAAAVQLAVPGAA